MYTIQAWYDHTIIATVFQEDLFIALKEIQMLTPHSRNLDYTCTDNFCRKREVPKYMLRAALAIRGDKVLIQDQGYRWRKAVEGVKYNER